MDFTTIHPSCTELPHRVDLHLWRGPPKNLDEEYPVQILVNDGYVVGFCPQRLQPLWSAYRVAYATDDVKYDRPLVYYDDMRLPDKHRIGRRTFGKLGGIQLNVGHMTPNEVINRQFGRLAQMETFLMSNMSPQYGSLNSGVWLKLENAIRQIEDGPGKDHVWAIVGPVFGDDPASINRGQGKYLPVPDSYFCVMVDPHTYPYDTPSRAHIDCFIIPQDAPRSSYPEDYPATLEEVEGATNLDFFAGWGRRTPVETRADGDEEAPSQSRLLESLWKNRAAEEKVAARAAAKAAKAVKAAAKADHVAQINALIKLLEDEAAGIEVQGRALTLDEIARVRSLQHTISYLIQVRGLLTPPPNKPPKPPTMVTYKIVSDIGDKLLQGARTACNFWNRFVEPETSIVIRLGAFTQNSLTIARAYRPYTGPDGTRYGEVEFNTKYLVNYADEEIAGTIVHELGHSLGIGFEKWDPLFHEATGLFTPEAIARLPALAEMEVERDGGLGTRLSHWDEARFDKELMTGYQDSGEHVLPVTFDVMGLLGHKVVDRVESETPLSELLQRAASVVFSRQDEAQLVDREHHKRTELFETIPHEPKEDG